MSQIELLTETNFSDIETITEATGANGQKEWYIQGTFLQMGVVNRNRRLYPVGIMEGEVANYVKNYVAKNRAIGELDHPKTIDINLDKIAMRTESIIQQGNSFIGKAKILNTPSGNIAKGLLEGGVQLGVSSRGAGSVSRNSQGVNEVNSDFTMRAIDIVFDPSAPDAFVTGLMEGAEFVWDSINEDTEFVEGLRADVAKANSTQLQEATLQAWQNMIQKISV